MRVPPPPSTPDRINVTKRYNRKCVLHSAHSVRQIRLRYIYMGVSFFPYLYCDWFISLTHLFATSCPLPFDRKYDRMEDNAEFISVIFVTSGTRGDRLLFKYPFELDNENAVALRSK